MPGLWRVFWLVVLAGHLAAAGAWLWLMPSGFPVGHPRFWANQAGPILVIAWASAAVWAARRRRMEWLRLALIAFPSFWAAAAVAGRLAFPISLSRFWLAPLGVAAVMALGA